MAKNIFENSNNPLKKIIDDENRLEIDSHNLQECLNLHKFLTGCEYPDMPEEFNGSIIEKEKIDKNLENIGLLMGKVVGKQQKIDMEIGRMENEN